MRKKYKITMMAAGKELAHTFARDGYDLDTKVAYCLTLGTSPENVKIEVMPHIHTCQFCGQAKGICKCPRFMK